MALAIIVTLEKEIPEASAAYLKLKSGKALARESDRLDFAARSTKVPAITAMLSESQAALIEQLKADGFDPSKMRLPPEQWYPASEGLTTLGALIDYVQQNLNNFKQPNPILKDLKAAQALLEAAEKSNVRFHFTKIDL